MTRNRRSAKQAGASFERLIANHLAHVLNNPTIDRLVKTGTKDRGDIGNVRDTHGRLIAIECKNTATLALPQWAREAQTEAEHYGAHAGITIHKRRGTTNPADQWVHMTVADLTRLLTKETP